MPKNEPDLTDPMELAGVAFDDPSGESTRIMAECFADEFLRLGHSPVEVMDLFRCQEHRLANHAWQILGDVKVYLLVRQLAERQERLRESIRKSREARQTAQAGS